MSVAKISEKSGRGREEEEGEGEVLPSSSLLPLPLPLPSPFLSFASSLLFPPPPRQSRRDQAGQSRDARPELDGSQGSVRREALERSKGGGAGRRDFFSGFRVFFFFF